LLTVNCRQQTSQFPNRPYHVAYHIVLETIRPEFGGINSYALYTLTAGTLACYTRATYSYLRVYLFRLTAPRLSMVWVISNYIYRKYDCPFRGVFQNSVALFQRPGEFRLCILPQRWQTIISYTCTFARRPQSIYILCNQSMHLYRSSPWFPVPVDNL